MIDELARAVGSSAGKRGGENRKRGIGILGVLIPVRPPDY